MIMNSRGYFLTTADDEQAGHNSNQEERDSCLGVDGDSLEDEVTERDAREVEIERLQGELQSVQVQAAETHDRMLRLAAEFDNAKKRWDRERQDVRSYAVQEFARDLLPVIDAFEKAIAAASCVSLSEDSEEAQRLKAVCEGVTMVNSTFLDTLGKHGIERLPGKGEPFDPSFHNAIAKEVNPALERDTIIEEFVSGYRICDRVLRTAMVRVGTPD